MCKITLSPCRLQVEARRTTPRPPRNSWNGSSSQDGHFCYFPVFSPKKNILLYDWKKATPRTLVHIKGGPRTLPGVLLPPPTCSGFSVQFMRNKEEKKNPSASGKNSNNKWLGMSASSIRRNNAKSSFSSSFNVIIQNGPLSWYQAQFTFHIFKEKWFLFTTLNYFIKFIYLPA